MEYYENDHFEAVKLSSGEDDFTLTMVESSFKQIKVLDDVHKTSGNFQYSDIEGDGGD